MEWTNTFTNKPTDRALIIHTHWLRDNHTEVQKYTHTHSHSGVHTHTHTHTHSGANTHTASLTHTHTHTHTQWCTHTHTHTVAHAHAHTQWCTHTHTHTHACTYNSLCQHLPSIFATQCFHKGSETNGSFAQSDEKRKRVPSSWTKIILIIYQGAGSERNERCPIKRGEKFQAA